LKTSVVTLNSTLQPIGSQSISLRLVHTLVGISFFFVDFSFFITAVNLFVTFVLGFVLVTEIK